MCRKGCPQQTSPVRSARTRHHAPRTTPANRPDAGILRLSRNTLRGVRGTQSPPDGSAQGFTDAGRFAQQSGITSAISGPVSRPVSARRSGMNSPLPLRPVASFTAAVHAPQVACVHGCAGNIGQRLAPQSRGLPRPPAARPHRGTSCPPVPRSARTVILPLATAQNSLGLVVRHAQRGNPRPAPPQRAGACTCCARQREQILGIELRRRRAKGASRRTRRSDPASNPPVPPVSRTPAAPSALRSAIGSTPRARRSRKDSACPAAWTIPRPAPRSAANGAQRSAACRPAPS
jgi:hypothetical protein